MNFDPATRSARAKALAQQHGFALSGIARVPEDGASPRAASFAAWIAKGFHGSMEYLSRAQEARQNLRSRFPWAQSVLALGAFYDAKPLGRAGKDLAAHVARYARGRDYHSVFDKRLKRLAAALKEAGVCSREWHYADTGPVLERAWAEAAGVGWIGKNTCLIHPRLGSYFLLAEIVLDLPLEPDTPALPHCGTCTRCLDACPTQAFTAPGVMDARRCIVTWNLEEKGLTPRETWPQQGEWAAGCDICQVVCPYNASRRIPDPDPELAAPLPWQNLTLAEAMLLSPEAFDRAFPRSALRRTGVKGLRLGVITVAGNTRAGDCIDALKICLNDPDGEIRERAAWALECLCLKE